MWGDDPKDYRTMTQDSMGFFSVDLPVSEELSCGCTLSLEWIFTAGSNVAVACVATDLRFGENCVHNPTRQEEIAKKYAGELYRRYIVNCVELNRDEGEPV